MLLDRRAFDGAVRTENAAVACFRAQQGRAAGAGVKELAGIGRHDFPAGKPALRAGQHRFEDGGVHRLGPGVDGGGILDPRKADEEKIAIPACTMHNSPHENFA